MDSLSAFYYIGHEDKLSNSKEKFFKEKLSFVHNNAHWGLYNSFTGLGHMEKLGRSVIRNVLCCI